MKPALQPLLAVVLVGALLLQTPTLARADDEPDSDHHVETRCWMTHTENDTLETSTDCSEVKEEITSRLDDVTSTIDRLINEAVPVRGINLPEFAPGSVPVIPDFLSR